MSVECSEPWRGSFCLLRDRAVKRCPLSELSLGHLRAERSLSRFLISDLRFGCLVCVSRGGPGSGEKGETGSRWGKKRITEGAKLS